MEQLIPRTQKARGVVWLQNNSSDLPGVLYGKVNYHKVLDARIANPYELINKFCRPCPMRPRHGFVDSRYINSIEEANDMIRATLAADPDAEILIAKPIEATYSAVWTRGLFAIGKGTDGATAGTSSRTIPVTGELLKGLDYSSVINHAPYAELLYRNGEPYIVQLRDGEPVPDSLDWIPYPFKVNRVVKAQGDLLEWEAMCRELNGARDVVVDHSNGGSLASHYAQHCVLNNLPIVTSHSPQVGEQLSANSTTPQISIAKLRAGFVAAQRMPIDYRQAVYIMLAGCHHIAKWAGREDFLLGLAMGAAYRLTVVAALGEVRHWHLNKRKRARSIVYDRAWNKTDSAFTRIAFAKAIAKFSEYDSWSSSYGGPKWEQFSLLAVSLYNALVTANATDALESLNRLVNAAHNNGWAFDKFIHSSTMAVAASAPVQMVVACGPQLYEAPQYAVATWKRRKLRVPDAPPIKPIKIEQPGNGPIVEAQIFVAGNKGHVQYKHAGEDTAYHSLNVVLTNSVENYWPEDSKTEESFAQSGKLYHKLKKVGTAWYYHSQEIFSGKEN